MPATITAVSTVPRVRDSNEWPSSSMANTTPASGVLNAAATPAAPPASTSARSSSSRGSRSTRPSACMMAAPTCTVGPLAADRGAAGQAEQGQPDLAQRRCAATARGRSPRGRSCAAPRSPAGCRCPGRRETRSASAGTHATTPAGQIDEGDPGARGLEAHEQRRGAVGQHGEADRHRGDQHGADPEHHRRSHWRGEISGRRAMRRSLLRAMRVIFAMRRASYAKPPLCPRSAAYATA